uniref:Uncharacterized protein n=1 Tax=Arundo donax TaxID=35708 RepID=A0A0A9HU19_ARUDO
MSNPIEFLSSKDEDNWHTTIMNNAVMCGQWPCKRADSSTVVLLIEEPPLLGSNSGYAPKKLPTLCPLGQDSEGFLDQSHTVPF